MNLNKQISIFGNENNYLKGKLQEGKLRESTLNEKCERLGKEV